MPSARCAAHRWAAGRSNKRPVGRPSDRAAGRSAYACSMCDPPVHGHVWSSAPKHTASKLATRRSLKCPGRLAPRAKKQGLRRHPASDGGTEYTASHRLTITSSIRTDLFSTRGALGRHQPKVGPEFPTCCRIWVKFSRILRSSADFGPKLTGSGPTLAELGHCRPKFGGARTKSGSFSGQHLPDFSPKWVELGSRLVGSKIE